MNIDSGQIDRIVREVMRQMMSLDAPTRDDSSGDPRPVTHITPTLVVADRLVTMASLSGRLVGVAHVQVRPDAVVTPLVCDSLREQGIRLERQAAASQSSANCKVQLVLVADDVQILRIASLLDNLAPGWQRCTSSDDAFAQLAGATSNSVALVLSREWARVVCQANRHPELRAASVPNVQAVRDACQQIDANVVAVDATQLTTNQLQDVVREFLANSARSHHAEVPSLTQAAVAPHTPGRNT